ncbi:MAG: isopeptide-forming domain-containing fimbrial protein [bacterium]|nr:isopeptide-forming domain-containing fimbrial protein [bacterium]
MKKMLKSIVSLLLVLMLLASTATVLAEGYKVIIKNENANITIVGSEFNFYKLFSVAYNTTTDAITYSYDDTCVAAEYNGKSGNDLIPVIENMTTEEINEFAAQLYANRGSTPTYTETATSETLEMMIDAPGYYLVTVTVKNTNGAEDKNTNGAEVKDTVVSRAILVSVYQDETTIALKADAPGLTKEILHNELNTWGSVGDNASEDIIYYQITTTVCDTTGYTKYDYIIHDIMDPGLTLYAPETIEIADLDKKYYTVTTTCDDGDTFEVKVDILQAVADGVLKAGDQLVTTCSAVLNKNAKIYSEGHNDNVAYLEYSNNVYDTKSTGATPEVKVYDWTFKADVKKADDQGNTLAGAIFVLSKSNNLSVTYDAENGLSSTDDLIPFVVDGTKYMPAQDVDESTVFVIDASEFTLYYLDDAVTYYLYEVQEPAGYSKLQNPISIKITAEYNNIGDEIKKTLLAVSGDQGAWKVDEETNVISVINVSGSVLPSTGGMGTTVFYVIGGVLVLGAVVIMLLRRRTNK